MRCDQMRIRLADYSAQRCDPSEHEQVRAHLAGCAACRGLLQEESLLLNRLASLSPVEPRRDLWQDVREAIGETVPAHPIWVWRRLSLGVATLAAAAAALTFSLAPRPPEATVARTPAALSNLAVLDPNQRWTVDDPLGQSLESLEELLAQAEGDSDL